MWRPGLVKGFSNRKQGLHYERVTPSELSPFASEEIIMEDKEVREKIYAEMIRDICNREMKRILEEIGDELELKNLLKCKHAHSVTED